MILIVTVVQYSILLFSISMKKEMKSRVIMSLEESFKTKDVLSDIYLGCGDSTGRVVSRKFQVFSHLDGEAVAVRCLIVQSLRMQEEVNSVQNKSKFQKANCLMNSLPSSGKICTNTNV